MAIVITSKQRADSIKKELVDYFSVNKEKSLHILLVGQDLRSEIYVKLKQKFGKEIGINVIVDRFDENISFENIKNFICNLNIDEKVNGIIIQSPLPKNLNLTKLCRYIDPAKDTDAMNPLNLGLLFDWEEDIVKPATVEAVLDILKNLIKVPIAGKHIVIINRSVILGRPLAATLINQDATVTICHTKTQSLKKECLNADIIVTAAGVKNLITADMVNKNTIIIDCGISKDDTGVYGDVDFNNVSKKVYAITAVPGGVGPLTVVHLFNNLKKLITLNSKK